MQVILIRHGSTEGNALRQYIGTTDEPLSQQGIEQVEAAGADINVKQVWVSSRLRTHQTAKMLFPNAHQTGERAFDEMSFGEFEGKNYAQLEHNSRYRQWVEGGCIDACPGGESRVEFSQRVCTAFERIIKEHQCQDSLVFVVHGGTIMAILERFAVPKMDYYSYAAKNCTGYICDVCRDGNGKTVLENLSVWTQNT